MNLCDERLLYTPTTACSKAEQQLLMDARAAAFVHYYAREGYVHHVQNVCNELIKHASSPVLQFWRAYGLLASGATAEVRGTLLLFACVCVWCAACTGCFGIF